MPWSGDRGVSNHLSAALDITVHISVILGQETDLLSIFSGMCSAFCCRDPAFQIVNPISLPRLRVAHVHLHICSHDLLFTLPCRHRCNCSVRHLAGFAALKFAPSLSCTSLCSDTKCCSLYCQRKPNQTSQITPMITLMHC